MITLRDLSTNTIKEKVGSLLEPQVHRSEIVIDGGGYGPNRQTRRAHVRERFKVMNDDFDDLAEDWISDIWREPEIVDELKRHVLALFNPPKRAVDRLAVAYTHIPIRKIKGQKTKTAKWTDFLERSHFNLHMRQFNRSQCGYNTAVAIPLLRKTADGDATFDYQIVTGAIGEICNDTDRSDFSPPDILFWRLPMHAMDPAGKPVIRAVDSEFFVAFDRDGRLIPSETRRHGLGMLPAALFRNTIPGDSGTPEDAWWDPWPNKGAYRAMRSVTRVIANLDWTRKTQCRYLIAEIVNSESDEEGGGVDEQVMGDAEGMMRLRGEALKLQVDSIIVTVKDWKDHVRMYQDEALEQMTGAPAQLSDPDPGNPLEGEQAARAHSAIDLHRIHQVRFLRPGDLRLQRVQAAILSRVGSPDAIDPQLLKDKSEIEYMPLPFIDDREKRLNWYILASKYGITDQVKAYVEFNGGTEEQALEKLLAIQERRKKMRAIQDDAQEPGGREPHGDDAREEDPGLPSEGVAEQQGRTGGRASPPSQGEAAR